MSNHSLVKQAQCPVHTVQHVCRGQPTVRERPGHTDSGHHRPTDSQAGKEELGEDARRFLYHYVGLASL